MRKRNSRTFSFKKGKKYNNRLYDIKNKRKTFRRKKTNFKLRLNINILYIFYSFLLILTWSIAFLMLWSTFKIKDINVIPRDDISNRDIAYNYLDNIRGKSIFFIEETIIDKKLKEYQKNLNVIKVEKQFPNTIRIEIWSYESVFNTIINKKNYIITSNWTLVNSEHSDKLINLQIKWNIPTSSSLLIPDYKNIIPEENVNKITGAYNEIKENLIWIKINYLSYYPIEREIHFSVNNETLLIFDLTKDLKRQIKNLIIFNTNHFKLIKDSLVYIDLRIDKKIFYCDKENEYKCNLNLEVIYKR